MFRSCTLIFYIPLLFTLGHDEEVPFRTYSTFHLLLCYYLLSFGNLYAAERDGYGLRRRSRRGISNLQH